MLIVDPIHPYSWKKRLSKPS